MSASNTNAIEDLKDFLAHNIAKSVEKLEKLTKEIAKDMQDMVKPMKDYIGKFENGASIYQAIDGNRTVQKIQIVSQIFSKRFSIADYVLELYITDDRTTFYAKIGSDIISGLTFAKTLESSKKIADYLINRTNIIPKGGHPVIIVIGGVAGLFMNKTLGDITDELIKNATDFIVNEIFINKGRNLKNPTESIKKFFQKYLNFPAQPRCPKGSIMPNGSCTPSVQEFFGKYFGVLSIHPYPKPSQAYIKALAKIKELESRLTFANSNHIQSDIEIDYIDEKDWQTYEEQQQILKKEKRLYKKALQNYEEKCKVNSQRLHLYVKILPLSRFIKMASQISSNKKNSIESIV